MSRDLALVRSFTRDILLSPTLTALFVAIVIMVSALDTAIVGRLALNPLVSSGNVQAIGATVGVAGYFACFVASGIAYAVLLVVPLTRQKANGVLVCLLATPVGARRLWWTRALALWFPSLLAGTLAAAGVVVALATLTIPDETPLVLSGWTVAATLVLVPLAYLALSLLITGIGLTSSPNAANAIGIAYYAGGSALLGNIMARAGLGPEGLWWVTLGLTAATALGAAAIAPRVTAQRVVLS